MAKEDNALALVKQQLADSKKNASRKVNTMELTKDQKIAQKFRSMESSLEDLKGRE